MDIRIIAYLISLVPYPFGTAIKNEEFKFFLAPSQFRRDKVLARIEHVSKKTAPVRFDFTITRWVVDKAQVVL